MDAIGSRAEEFLLPPKAATLVSLARAGLPVPAGVVVHASEVSAARDPTRELLAGGLVIVRSAFANEDGVATSQAGLGLSVPGCADEEAVAAAVTRILEAASSTLGDPFLIIQRQVPRATLVVAAVLAPEVTYIETHRGSGEVLSTGAAPNFAGPLDDWPAPARADVERLLGRAITVVPPGAHGIDAELVVDPGGGVHLVQARPLAAPLVPGAAEFLQLVEACGETPRLEVADALTLDAEHNASPLSPAHQSLLDHLRARAPAAGKALTLAGYLYVETPIRDLARADMNPVSARGLLVALLDEWIPAAHRRALDVAKLLAACTPETFSLACEAALQAFEDMISIYVRELVRGRQVMRTHGLSPDPAASHSLLAARLGAGVLPRTWDVASPPVGGPGAEGTFALDTAGYERLRRALPQHEAAAATLLAELDDHLFALGLWPVRAAILAAARLGGVPDSLAFGFRLEELEALARGEAPLAVAHQRLRLIERARAVVAPARLLRGHPLPGRIHGANRGLCIGPGATGTAHVFADCALLQDVSALPKDAVVVVPGLTAQAVLELHRLQARAVITVHGGAMSHAALMTRELGLSALLGVASARTIAAGERVSWEAPAGALTVRARA